MNGETWRVIPSLRQYLASSEGRVMRVPHFRGARQYGGTPHFGVWEKVAGRFVMQFEGKTYKIHRLICEAFHGFAPDDKPVCMHLDENAANNRADNLAWGTQKENLNAPAVKTYHRARTGDDNPYRKGIRAREGCI